MSSLEELRHERNTSLEYESMFKNTFVKIRFITCIRIIKIERCVKNSLQLYNL